MLIELLEFCPVNKTSWLSLSADMQGQKTDGVSIKQAFIISLLFLRC